MSWFRKHYPKFRLGLRITVAGLLAYALCPLFGVRQTYQAVLTAIIVMQGSAGASLKAMLERFTGSLGGALWAVAVLVTFQRLNSPVHPAAMLAVVLVPVALFAAFKPGFRAAPATAIILLLGPNNIGGPLTPAIQRMLGVGLGSIAAMIVALLVLPAKVDGTFAEAAGRAANKMSELAAILIKGAAERAEPAVIRLFHDEIRKSINQAELAAEEVLRERIAHLSAGPDPLPMCRALRRIRNDLAMIGRLTLEAFPELVRERLTIPSKSAAAAATAFLRDCGSAISGRLPAPSFESCERALMEFASTLKGLRWVGPMRELPDDVVARIFGLAFTLEQLERNLKELVDRIGELSAERK